MTKLQEAFSLFYAKDDLRPKFHNPLIWNKKVFATDAHTLIIVDEKDLDFEFENEYDSPDLTTILPKANTLQKVIIPNLDIFKTDDETKEVGENVKCDECNGRGEVEWEYERWTRDFDCPKCDGTGYSDVTKDVPTGNKTFRNIKVKIKESYFDIFKFNKLLEVQKLLGGEIELIYYDENKNATLFKIGICNVLIMKYMAHNPKDFEILTIDTI